MNTHADGIAFEKPQKPVFQNPEKSTLKEEIIIDPVAVISESGKDETYIGHLASIVESSDDAIISKSLNGTIKSWNKGAEKMFGYTSAETIGKNISLIIPPEYITEEKQILEKIRNNKSITHFETSRLKKMANNFMFHFRNFIYYFHKKPFYCL